MKGFETVLFVHVPKTAGTSFRLAIEELFGAGRVSYDYSPRAQETSAHVRAHYYEHKDLERLRARLIEARCAVLGGHFPFRRYASILPPSRVITFLREPIARLASEHEHACRHNGFTGTLLQFAAIPRNQNLQSNMLRGVPLERAAVVGITERYGDSLALVERRLGWKVPELVRNVNPNRTVLGGSYALDADIERQLRTLNTEDLVLYEEALRRFEEQLADGGSADASRRFAPAGSRS